MSADQDSPVTYTNNPAQTSIPQEVRMPSGIIAAGLGLAVVGYAGRTVARLLRDPKFKEQVMKQIPEDVSRLYMLSSDFIHTKFV